MCISAFNIVFKSISIFFLTNKQNDLLLLFNSGQPGNSVIEQFYWQSSFIISAIQGQETNQLPLTDIRSLCTNLHLIQCLNWTIVLENSFQVHTITFLSSLIFLGTHCICACSAFSVDFVCDLWRFYIYIFNSFRYILIFGFVFLRGTVKFVLIFSHHLCCCTRGSLFNHLGQIMCNATEPNAWLHLPFQRLWHKLLPCNISFFWFIIWA